MATVLLIGESWFRVATDVRGFDSFSSTSYGVGTEWIERAMVAAGHRFRHLPTHLVDAGWPDLSDVDVVMISDVGANTFLLGDACWNGSRVSPNRLQELADFAHGGGGLGMIGGYLSFAGLHGRAAYRNTALAHVLPVEIAPHDDRVDLPEGIEPVAVAAHPAVPAGVRLGPLLGYNRVALKPGADLLAACGDDPLLAVWRAGRGRVFAYTSDCSEHWATLDYLGSEDYAAFWGALASWCAGEADA